MNKIAVIVGAGPAGLTAAHELLRCSGVKPVVFEGDAQVGGISKTVNYCGNRMDLGGHRFFSKSDWVMNWWQSMLPVEESEAHRAERIHLAYHGEQRDFVPSISTGPGHERVMLIRSRLSRIFYRRRFFDYPLKLNWTTLNNLGLLFSARIGASYVASRIAPRTPEATLEDFLINRFGDQLYRTFFKDYTEKVWGVPCEQISAEWGAQRIKGLSITKALAHAIKKPFRSPQDARQKDSETSLIERFLYPKLGPGQLWEEAALRVTSGGGEVHLNHRVIGVSRVGHRVTGVQVRDESTGNVRQVPCDYLISTMPVKDLAGLLQPEDSQVLRVANALPYRDFMTVGLLVNRMRPTANIRSNGNNMPPDNWIYVQESDVKLGRLQIFNNWSPSLVADPTKIWLGLEYFCAEGDGLWNMRDSSFIDFASRELAKIGFIDLNDVVDGTVVRVPKAYPAYFGEYAEIGRVRSFLDEFANVFAVGRNGMHRYNNQDHSMLAAKAAVDCIVGSSSDKSSLWAINVEGEYHETIEKPATAIARAA
jgi:protoporphyrinogen oxidase